ncbi:hypothetical protein MRX96_035759 [Rhipicephalus microplus]
MLPTTVTYRTVAAFTFGLPLLLFVLVVVISYIYIASPCQDPPEWRECVPMLAVSLYYFDPKSADCLPRDTLPKGCLNGSNGFEDLQQCQQACAIHPRTSSAKLPNADDCVNPIVGEACDDRLLRLQFFFNPLRSSCENLTDLCLAGRNRFDSYQECSGACLNRDDYHARRRHQEGLPPSLAMTMGIDFTVTALQQKLLI